MKKVQILSIPNYYSSYYLYGFSNSFDLKFTPEARFQKFNNQGFLIFEIEGKLGVVDNHDPIGVNQELYEQVDFYFATNKLLDQDSYNQKKVRPLFPHYPVNCLGFYLRFFGIELIKSLSFRDLAREIYVLNSRPKFRCEPKGYNFSKYIFFSGSTWKKEPWANQIRAEFIRACKSEPDIQFEGGFIPRTDGNNFGFDKELNQKQYSPKEFSKLSAQSLVNLNNPAVLGAVSWRLAEYWNFETFVLSFPFAIDLPVPPKHGKEIHFIESEKEYSEVLKKVLKDPVYHQKVAEGGKAYFNRYCTPEAQATYIQDIVLESQ